MNRRERGAAPNRSQEGPVSWRRASSRGAASGSQPTSSAWWMTGGGHETMKHTIKLILALGIVGILVFLVLILPKGLVQTPFIALVVTDYQPLIPPNSMAKEDGDWFSRLWARGDSDEKEIGFWGGTEDTKSTTYETANSCLNSLDADVRPGGPNKDIVLFYISAHGAINSKGEPCLLFSSAKPHDETTWTPVAGFLQEIVSRASRKSQNAEEVKTVVFLDASRMLCEMHLGMLYNGFNERLEAVVSGLEGPIVVVNSASAGEIGWHAPEHGLSVFGLYVGQGLCGLVPQREKKDRVTLGELAEFLQDRVASWVKLNRAASQHPQFIASPQAKDWTTWPLAWVSEASGRAAEGIDNHNQPTPEVEQRCSRLEALWRQYDEVTTSPQLPSRTPLELAEIHFQLARLERLVLAGKAYEREFNDAADHAGGLLTELNDRSARPSFLALTVSQAAAVGDAEQLQAFLAKWAAAPNSDADSWKEVPFPRSVVATGIIKWLVSGDGKLRDFSQLDDMLKMINKAPVARTGDNEKEESSHNADSETADEGALSAANIDLVEVDFLRMLATHVDRQDSKDLAIPAIEQAISTRYQAEESAMLTDERAHYWMRARINLADRRRRLAEDRLLVGSAERLKLAVEGLSGVVKDGNGVPGDYLTAKKERDSIARAYRVRDQAWWQMSDLVTWLAAESQFGNRQVTATDFTTLEKLADNVHQLAETLDQQFRTSLDLPEPEFTDLLKSRADEIARIQVLADQIETDLNKAIGQYRSLWETWPLDPDKSSLSLWGATLQIPLAGANGISGAHRSAWRKQYMALLFTPDDTDDTSRRDWGQGKTTAKESTAADANLLSILAEIRVHPLVAIVKRRSSIIPDESIIPTRRGETIYDKVIFLAEESGLVRRLLRADTLTKEVETLVSQLEQSLQANDTARSQRLNLSRADNMVRAATGLTVLDSQSFHKLLDHPTETLERFDLRNYLLWQAGRVMLDLWNDQLSNESPYYVRAFDAYASSAEDVFPMYERKHRLDGLDLKSVCNQLQEQLDAEEGATPKLQGSPIEESGSLVLPVTAQSPKLENRQAPWAMCEPYVAVRTPEDGGQKAELTISAGDASQLSVRRVGIPLSDDRLILPLKVHLEKDQIENKLSLNVVGFFRGRNQVVPFGIQLPEFSARPTIISRPQFATPTVRVSGSFEKKVAIMFVLDSSVSMKKPVPGAGVSRLDVATRALDTILADLLDNLDSDHECRVGLLVYGHRAGIDSHGKPVWSPAYKQRMQQIPGAKPKTGDDDLEFIVHLNSPANPLSDELRKAIAKQAEGWSPLGNTPLYYSMREALREFDSVPDVDSRHLIVITDGQNYVNGQDNEGTPPDWLRELGVKDQSGRFQYAERQVAQMVNRSYRDVEINVLGIGMEQRDFDDKLKTINASSLRKGKFYPVSKRVEFVSAIETALGLGDYVVQDEKNQSPPTKQRVNTICPLKSWPMARLFMVSMPDLPSPPRSANLLAEGGEAFELKLDLVHRRIVHQRYEPPQRHPIKGSATDAFVSALFPQRNGDSVTFAVTVQNQDAENFSPRPLGIWATITPTRTPEGEEVIGPPYHFYDPIFEQGTPVPVLDFTAHQWPPPAYGAKIELWYLVSDGINPDFQDIRPDGEKDLTALSNQPEFRLENIPGVSFTVRKSATDDGNGWRVTVEERYDSGENDTHKSRVMTEPKADQIIRYFHPQGGLARHVFEYYGGREPRRLLITSRSSIQHRYAQLDQPISVKLPERQ